MISGTRYQLRLETNRQLRLSSDISRAQAEISTGKKILAPSDDPAASARISEIGRAQANMLTWRGNLNKAEALSAQADGVLASVATTFDRAKELLLSAANATTSSGDRQSIALELYSLADHVESLRNTRDSRGELIFQSGQTVAIPVGANLEITATATREAVFDTVVTSYGTDDLVSMLRGTAGSVVGGAAAPLATRIRGINDAIAHISTVRAEHGARANRIDSLIEESYTNQVIMEDERTGLESTNIAEVVARLQAKELSLEAAQAVFARIHRSNLFDLLG